MRPIVTRGLTKVSAETESILGRFGVYVFPWGKRPPSIDEIIDLAKYAEELGFDSVHIPWHFTLPTNWIFPDFGNRFLMDPLVIFPILAHETKRVRLGFNAAILPILHPFLWAQYLASIDVVSGGRLIAGVAVGWWEDDFKIGLAPLGERGRRMDEALDILSKLWRGEQIDQAGRFWDASGLSIDPRPVQAEVPIWIGGGARSVDRAGRWAGALMPLNPSPEEVKEQFKPLLVAAGAAHRRQVELAIMNYGVFSEDKDWIDAEIRPKLRECVGFDVAGPNGLDAELDKRIMFGSPEQAAACANRLFAAGVDYIVMDFQLHGWESPEFAREQMTRFVNDVAPRIEAPPSEVVPRR
jgi:alkanesulfonate monooxygenase SsuD/methylene tetrahydromethanopterin reductase-like flavin-dependent oxidoreductase (luciferase family)